MNLRQLTTLIVAPLQFAAAAVHPLTGLGRSVGDMAQDAPTPATPAGYAFGIWTLIFILCTLYALHQAKREERHNPLYNVIGWPMAAAMALGCLWMLTAQLGSNGVLLLVLIFGMTACMLYSLLTATRWHAGYLTQTTAGQRILSPLLGLFGGWLSLAVFLNLGTTTQLTLGWPDMSRPVPAIALLCGAGILGLAVMARLHRVPRAACAYAFTLVWGLLATALANTAHSPFTSPVASFAVGLAAIVLAALILAGHEYQKRAFRPVA